MKFTKLLQFFSIAIVLSLLVMLIPATPALAARDIELFDEDGDSIDEAKIGDEITIIGDGFTASDSSTDTTRLVDIFLSSDEAERADVIDIHVEDYEDYLAVAIDDYGEFEYSFNVPAELDDGEDDVDVEIGETYYVYVTHSYLYTTPLVHSTFIEAVAELTIIGGGAISLDYTSGPVGTEVQITGTSFSSDKDISIFYDSIAVTPEAGSDVETDSDGDFVSYILIPDGTAGAHTILVTVSGSSLTATFTVEPEITISPTSGEAEAQVTVSGTGFGRRTTVNLYFNNQPWGTALCDAEGSFTTVPPLAVLTGLPAGIYDIDAEDSQGEAETYFTVIVPPPVASPAAFTVSNLTVQPAEIEPGGVVAITALVSNTGGSSGTHDVVLNINGVEEAQESVTVAAGGSQTVSFSVTKTELGEYSVALANLSGSFTVVEAEPPEPPAPTYQAKISNDSGKVGMYLGVNGSGFVANGTVTVSYDDTVMASANTDNYGIFLVTFQVPAGAPGAHTVTVTDGAVSEEITFTLEAEPTSPPPIPSPLLPQMGVNVEQPVSFDWADVTGDVSPITYTLQIATGKDFTNASMVLEKTAITLSQYTLTEEEFLKLVPQEAPYYWRLRAVDAASTEGSWTGTGEFYIAPGFSLPDWALYTLMGLGALVIFAVGYWLGRRTAYYY